MRHIRDAIEILVSNLVRVELATDEPGMHRIALHGYQVGPPMDYATAQRRAAMARVTLKGAMDSCLFLLGLGSDA